MSLFISLLAPLIKTLSNSLEERIPSLKAKHTSEKTAFVLLKERSVMYVLFKESLKCLGNEGLMQTESFIFAHFIQQQKEKALLHNTFKSLPSKTVKTSALAV